MFLGLRLLAQRLLPAVFQIHESGSGILFRNPVQEL